MSSFDLMSVREMIDAAFGENNSSCPVNFHMIGTVLFILARRMDLLKRNFKVKVSETTSNQITPKPLFAITEIKVHTKKNKQGNMLTNKRQQSDKRSTGKHKSSSQMYSKNLPTYKKPTGKRSTDASSSEMSSALRSSSIKYSPDSRFTETFPLKQRSIQNYAIQITQGARQKTGKYIDEIFPTERNEVGEYSDAIYIRERHKARKYSERKGPGKSYSPDVSSESAISGKSKSAVLRDQNNEVVDIQFNEVGSNERNIQYEVDDNDDDLEAHHEKIYLVTRTVSGRETGDSGAVLNPVVTQEQFNSLIEKTRILQKQYGIPSKTKAKWDDFSFHSTSVTHPNAALNISMRLNTAETRLERMLDIVAHFARHVPEINTEADKSPPSLEPQINLNPFRLSGKPPQPMRPMRRSTAAHDLHTFHSIRETDSLNESELSMQSMDNVTHGQLQNKLKKVQDNVLKSLREAIDNANVEKCNQTLVKHELKVRQMNNKLKGIVKLECAIGKLGKAVAAIDGRLTTQMTNFQDNLQQLQDDIEKAVENMNAALLSPKEDVAAVAQITEEFNNYDYDLKSTWQKQIDLKEEMGLCIKKFDSIEEDIEHLVDRKCTRKEMYEVLSDKVGVRDVNGQLTEDQFYAVTSDKKNTLQKMHLNIFSKECKWQKIIDETYKKSQENADHFQVESLEGNMQQYISMFNKDVNEISAIFGPLQRYPTDKKIKRDDNCISCGAAAKTVKDEDNVRIWRKILCSIPPDADTKSIKLMAEEKAKVCFPMRTIPHPLEQDSYICQHDCGNIVATTDFDLLIKELKPSSNNS